MADEDNGVGLSPTVLVVIDKFVSVMRADDTIENQVVDRIEGLLRKGTVPKADEINAALFNSLSSSKT